MISEQEFHTIIWGIIEDIRVLNVTVFPPVLESLGVTNFYDREVMCMSPSKFCENYKGELNSYRRRMTKIMYQTYITDPIPFVTTATQINLSFYLNSENTKNLEKLKEIVG